MTYPIACQQVTAGAPVLSAGCFDIATDDMFSYERTNRSSEVIDRAMADRMIARLDQSFLSRGSSYVFGPDTVAISDHETRRELVVAFRKKLDRHPLAAIFIVLRHRAASLAFFAFAVAELVFKRQDSLRVSTIWQ